MNLTKYNLFRPTKPLRMNQFLDDLAGSSFSDFFGADFVSATPSVNIVENEDSFLIDVAAPGLKKDDFQVNLENDNLVISASKKESNEVDDKGKFTRREFNYSSFRRSFHLSEEISTDKISASYANGILSIQLGKKSEEEDKKTTIEIN